MKKQSKLEKIGNKYYKKIKSALIGLDIEVGKGNYGGKYRDAYFDSKDKLEEINLWNKKFDRFYKDATTSELNSFKLCKLTIK